MLQSRSKGIQPLCAVEGDAVGETSVTAFSPTGCSHSLFGATALVGRGKGNEQDWTLCEFMLNPCILNYGEWHEDSTEP